MTRRRYIMRKDSETGELVCVEVTPDWTDAEQRAPVATEGVAYSNLQASDGTAIDSRRKHREYMQRNGLALMGDFSDETRKADKVRAEQANDRERKDTVGRAAYELEKGGQRATRQLEEREIERKGR